MKKFNITKNLIYDVIYWGFILVVIVWIILKLLGIIHSPVWQQMLPFAALVVPFIIKGMKDAESLALIKPMYEEIKEMRKDISTMDNRLVHVEKDVHYLRRDVDHLQKGFDKHLVAHHKV